ncbi:hypothetical protein ACFQEQ_04945 [Halolamina salina]
MSTDSRGGCGGARRRRLRAPIEREGRATNGSESAGEVCGLYGVGWD